jgi:hypothetical protein
LTESAVFALLIHAKADWTAYSHLLNVALIVIEFVMSRHFYIPGHVLFEVAFLIPFLCVLALWHHTSGQALLYSRLPFVWLNVAYYGTLVLGNISIFITLCGFDRVKQHVFKYHPPHHVSHDHEARAPLLTDVVAAGSMSNVRQLSVCVCVCVCVCVLIRLIHSLHCMRMTTPMRSNTRRRCWATTTRTLCSDSLRSLICKMMIRVRCARTRVDFSAPQTHTICYDRLRQLLSAQLDDHVIHQVYPYTPSTQKCSK